MSLDGKFDQLKGNVQQKVGDITNNEDLKAKGEENELAGKFKETSDKVSDAVNEKIDDLRK